MMATLKKSKKSVKPKSAIKKKAAKTTNKTKKLSGEVFYPSKEVIEQARVKDWDKLANAARRDPVGFWEKEALELEWFSKWKKVLDDS
ncbi:MAG: acetyl-coenzyme A synthetase N-terminal domain-containing protein, partial [Anaerolineales bacterium]